jgi:hypothetical protein
MFMVVCTGVGGDAGLWPTAGHWALRPINPVRASTGHGIDPVGCDAIGGLSAENQRGGGPRSETAHALREAPAGLA